MTTEKERLRWGIISTGKIARQFAEGVRGSTTGMVLAVASRTQAQADAFGAEFNIPHCYGDYQALLDDPEVEAVYIATPHPMHAEWAIKAAEAGKHLLVEKPIGMNAFEAAAMIDAAALNDVFLMEAFMYRCHPQIPVIKEIIHQGTIGEVRLIQATLSGHSKEGPEHRLFAQELGGGAILDVGCYPMSMARMLAGVAQGLPFLEPLEVKGCGHLGETGVDEWAIAALKFRADIVAQLTCGLRVNLENESCVTVFGSEGKLYIPTPWFSPVPLPERKLIIKRHDETEPRTIMVEAPQDLYTYEAEMVAAYLAERQAPAMLWDDTLGNMRALDRWRQELGLVYNLERPEKVVHTITRRPLARRADAPMRYGILSGLDKQVSRLIMGAMTNNTMPDTAILFDTYFELGGNTFDTSHAYGNKGACERNLGQWIRNRGIRDQVVVIEKAGNWHNGNPEGMAKEFLDGLDRLQMDSADIFMLHRDNLEVPIGEWVDAMNELLRARKMTCYGLSNFAPERLDAFTAYAQRTGQATFVAVSNNFSLARMIDPIWDQYLVSSSDAESRAWFARTGTPLFAWSSQARNFFTPLAGRGIGDDAELVRCWYSEDNFQRKERAERLAAEKGVQPIQIALAYVLCQPFPTYPLIGAKRPAEVHSSIAALSISLTPEELAWLNLEAEKS